MRAVNFLRKLSRNDISIMTRYHKQTKYTAEKVEDETPLTQLNCPLETPQLPFDDFNVKLLTVPDKVYVASVWVDQVPADRRPPVEEPEDRSAVIVAFEGRSPEFY